MEKDLSTNINFEDLVTGIKMKTTKNKEDETLKDIILSYKNTGALDEEDEQEIKEAAKSKLNEFKKNKLDFLKKNHSKIENIQEVMEKIENNTIHYLKKNLYCFFVEVILIITFCITARSWFSLESILLCGIMFLILCAILHYIIEDKKVKKFERIIKEANSEEITVADYLFNKMKTNNEIFNNFILEYLFELSWTETNFIKRKELINKDVTDKDWQKSFLKEMIIDFNNKNNIKR